MEVWLRGLMENLMDGLFDGKKTEAIKEQASHFAVEGVDTQNLYMGYINGFISGYADGAMTLMRINEPGTEEQEEVKKLMMRRSEEILKKLGIL